VSAYVGISPGTIAWAALQVVRMHEEPASEDRESGRCEQCRPDGWCDLLHWARLALASVGTPEGDTP
jgi:hypothetical protein